MYWVGSVWWFEWQVWVQPELGPFIYQVRHVNPKQLGLGVSPLPLNWVCSCAEQGQAKLVILVIRPNLESQKPIFKMCLSFCAKYLRVFHHPSPANLVIGSESMPTAPKLGSGPVHGSRNSDQIQPNKGMLGSLSNIIYFCTSQSRMVSQGS